MQDISYQEGSAGNTGILFHIGKFQVHTYSVAILVGILCSIATIVYFWKRQKYSWEVLQVCILISVPAGIIGSRLLYVVERLINAPADPFPSSHWYALWQGGLSIQGGVIFAAAIMSYYLYTKRILVDYKTVFGFILPSVIIGQAMGRWGNFANHEVYGKIDPGGATSSWLGNFIHSNMYISDDLGTDYRVPLFFYEFLTSMVGYVLILWVMLFFNWTKPGTTGSMYLFWYGLVRIIMEPFRQEHYTMYIVIAALFIVAGIISFIIFQLELTFKFNKKTRKWSLQRESRYERIKLKFNQHIFEVKASGKLSKRSLNAGEDVSKIYVTKKTSNDGIKKANPKEEKYDE